MATEDQRRHLGNVAKQTLDVFSQIATGARERLAEPSRPSAGAFASINAFTSSQALNNLDQVGQSAREDCERLAREPAIARVVVKDENGKREVYFISRAAALSASGSDARFVSYRAPVGRLASLPLGDSLDVVQSGRSRTLEVVERALLHPEEILGEWDARNTLFDTTAFGPITIDSLRWLVKRELVNKEALDEISKILMEEEEARGILEGRRKSIITKMGLRDQPVLDRFQDEIFRLPLDSQLVLLGPPGTGKTTTLIRRLGQKLDLNNLLPEERKLIDRAASYASEAHSQSWLMFTPTELLRHYVKEAFAKESIAAPDQRIRTWSTHRRDLARNTFSVLRTGTGGGSFVMKDDEPTLSRAAYANSIGWFEDFQTWQSQRFWADLEDAVLNIANAQAPDVSVLGAKLSAAVKVARNRGGPRDLLPLTEFSSEVRELANQLRKESDEQLRDALNAQLRQNVRFIDELAVFMDTLVESAEAPEGDDSDPDSDEDDEEESAPATRKSAAIAAYNTALRVQARSHAAGRAPVRGRSAAILKWLGERGLTEQNRASVAISLALQQSLRRFASPLRTYLNGIPRRYRIFRRTRRSDGTSWYTNHQAGRTAHPLEVDVILLSMLRAASEFIRDRRVLRNPDDPSFAPLKAAWGLQRNQILIDEATDFSAVQLACMAALAEPSTESFFACGDFNQRITSWGIKIEQELRWVWPKIDIREVTISYRPTLQLYELAQCLAALSDGHSVAASLPEDVNNDGVAPVLAVGMADQANTVSWLKHRIVEIEAAVRPLPLPSIAVFVNREADVQPLAEALDHALEDHSLRAIACVSGQTIGQENEVRIFDIEQIKGLEFEAVFFLGIDQLAAREPDLFGKYLYVGVTRAATYFGMTCEGILPARLAPLQSRFGSDWSPDGVINRDVRDN
ncbi:MAG: ATP-binding domain-containing protein [Alphaproteobacteria bacterium]